jgi:Slx4 endonuclease
MVSVLIDCWRAKQEHAKSSANVDEAHIPSTSQLSSEQILRKLYARISNIIKNDKDKSVYLGIIRYEPLIIEDLMTWLADRELALPEREIKTYCDKEGICCVTREALTFGRRVRMMESAHD